MFAAAGCLLFVDHLVEEVESAMRPVTCAFVAFCLFVGFVGAQAVPIGAVSVNGRWNTNIGLEYEIVQSGDGFIWGVVGRAPEGEGLVEGTAIRVWTPAAGRQQSVPGSIILDAHGRAVEIRMANDVVFTRQLPPVATILPGVLAPTAPGVATEPGTRSTGVRAGPDAVAIGGRWNTNIDVVYDIVQVGDDFLWGAVGGRPEGEGHVDGLDVHVRWTVEGRSESASGRIVLDREGRASRMEMSNGIVFTRHPIQVAVIIPGALPQPQPVGVLTRTDRPGFDYRSFDLPDSSPIPQLCELACITDQRCSAWTYVRPGVQSASARCYLKSIAPPAVADDCCISGVRPRPVSEVVEAVLPATPPGVLDSAVAAVVDVGRTIEVALRGAGWEDLSEIAAGIQADAFLRDRSRPSPALPSAPLAVAHAPGSIYRVDMVDPSFIRRRVTIDAVEPLVTDPGVLAHGPPRSAFALREGYFAIIHGEGFGKAPAIGGVRLIYTEDLEAFVTGAGTEYTLDLRPAGHSWVGSWFDDFIVVWLPYFPRRDGAVIEVARTARLLVYAEGSESFVTEHEVEVGTALPGFGRIDGFPGGSGIITSGGQVIIEGSQFGEHPGSVWLDVHGICDPDALPVVTGPVCVTGRIDLAPIPGEWSRNRIRLDVPEIRGNFAVEGVRITVQPAGDAPAGENTVLFSPKMVMLPYSGIEYFEIGKTGCRDDFEEQSEFLVVTHDPDCAPIWGTGCVGTDWFFRSVGLPKNVNLVRATIAPWRPDDDALLVKFLLDELRNIFETLAQEGPAGVLTLGFRYVMHGIAGMFDSTFMTYNTVIRNEPDPGDPLTEIYWSNTCWGPHKKVVNRYVANFWLYGPEDAMP
jgi:hypothetical protein